MNGFISMGSRPSSSPPTIPGSSNVVSPYGADIETRTVGTIRYTGFLTSHPEMRNVSDFINTKIGGSFTGTRMMVAEWDHVAKYGSRSVSLFFLLLGNSSCSNFLPPCLVSPPYPISSVL